MVNCGESEASGPEYDDAALLEDWITIWQSELAGLVLDRELQDAMLRLVDEWAAQARAAIPPKVPACDAK